MAMDLSIDGVGLFGYSEEYSLGCFPSFPVKEDSSEFSSPSLNFSTPFSNDLVEIESWLCSEEGEESQSVSMVSRKDSMDFVSLQKSLFFPKENAQLDNKLSIFHLIKAYGEAMEKNHLELLEVISARLEEKSCPLGEIVQRLAYHLIQDRYVNDYSYLQQESFKNCRSAFLAFYQIFPYGRFAHLAANSVILEALPKGEGTVIHIVDFDIGKGVQWSLLIESLARRNQREVKITSVKWEEDEYHRARSMSKFEEVKRQLCEFARLIHVKLEVVEIEMKELGNEMKKKGENSKWLAFNCMVGLPHMGRGRSSRDVLDFLKIAKDSIKDTTANRNYERGIITFGEGQIEERMGDCCDFGSFLEGQFGHSHALLESMEWCFPIEFIEARITMECLFVGPYFSSLACLKRWEEGTWGYRGTLEIGLEPWRMNKDSIEEAKELVREGESPFWVRFETQDENQMVLGYMGSPLVRISSWRCI